MTRREHAIVAAWGLGSALLAANLLVAGGVIVERYYQRKLCEAYRTVHA